MPRNGTRSSRPWPRHRLSRVGLARRVRARVRPRIGLSDGGDGGRVGVLPLVHIHSVLFGRTLTSLPFLNYGGVLARDAAAAAAGRWPAGVASRERALRARRAAPHRAPVRRFAVQAAQGHDAAARSRPADVGTARPEGPQPDSQGARSRELTVERGGAELLDDFYAVFARNMRDLGTPVYAARFFEEVLRAFPDRARRHRRATEGRAGRRRHDVSHTARRSKCRGRRRFASTTALCPNICCTGTSSSRRSPTAARCSTSAVRRRTKARSSSRSSGAPCRCRCTGRDRLLEGRAMPNASPTNPRFQLAVRLWKKLPLSIATRVGPSVVRAIP